MTDVFISYRRADHHKAQLLANALKDENLDVWWDASLEAGEAFDEKIQSLLQTAKAVVLLWSPAAVESEWVRSEGAVGRERGVLVPVMVKPVNIPVPFNVIHTADLTGWDGDRSDPTYMSVVKKLKTLASKQNVKPLKPPPNRQLRRLWQTVAVIGVLAVIGASAWVFKPWEAVIAANDPAIKAKAAHEASLANLAAFGLQPNDFSTYDWKQVAQKRFKPSTYPDLVKSADAGDPAAQALLCTVAYWGVTNVPEDEEVAVSNCRRGSEAGEPAAQVYYGYILGERSETDASTAQMKLASDQAFSWGLLEYGYRLENGLGVPADPQHALELYKTAEAQGLPAADYALSRIIGKGLVASTLNSAGDPDRTESLRYLQMAADKGFPPAWYELGEIYRTGYGVEKDYAKARSWYEKALNQTDNDTISHRAKGALQFLEADERDAEAAKASADTPPSP
jgi:TPR repeat protein